MPASDGARLEGKLSRRDFLRGAAAGAGLYLLDGCGSSGEPPGPPPPFPESPPNILWISAEDMSPDIGRYGDTYQLGTPAIDQLAAEGVRFDRAFANAGVSAPARSCIITGMYPTSIGTNNMRCSGVPPEGVKCFPEYLRAAGYYCTNNSKKDYQFQESAETWDASSGSAHWRNRPDPAQPFFAVFNYLTTHESNCWGPYGGLQHDPEAAELPPYYPDTSLVRQNWARYYDVIMELDGQVQARLDELDADGLADDTIVWFWGDHGRGLPRAKRWIYDSGIRVPLIVRVPEKYRGYVGYGLPSTVAPGSVSGELVSFVDFAPTMLALAGVPVPEHLQGQPFLTPERPAARQYVYAARDRMDEAYDLIRAARNGRYKYIRNYMHHVTQAQDIEYMNRMPIMQEWRSGAAAGTLAFPQTTFFEPTKPVEELYDTETDPHEVTNLAADPGYGGVLAELRAALDGWMIEVGDVGMIPEPEFDRIIRPGGTADPTWRATLDGTDLLARLRAIKELDGQGADAIPDYTAALSDPDAPVRYWAVVGLHVACTDEAARDPVRPALSGLLDPSNEPSACVRIAAAHALWDWDDDAQAISRIQAELGSAEKNVRLYAIVALYRLGPRAQPLKSDVEAAQTDSYNYVKRVAEHILAVLV